MVCNGNTQQAPYWLNGQARNGKQIAAATFLLKVLAEAQQATCWLPQLATPVGCQLPSPGNTQPQLPKEPTFPWTGLFCKRALFHVTRTLIVATLDHLSKTCELYAMVNTQQYGVTMQVEVEFFQKQSGYLQSALEHENGHSGKIPRHYWDVQNASTFPQTCSTHTNMYAYLPIFISCWNMQEYSDSHLFQAGDDRFCGHFAFLRHDIKLAIFCIAHLNCIFQGASFELKKQSGNFDSRNVTRFLRNPPIPLLHPTQQL